ncbi:carbohydrate esterase family 3 protein [Cadophora sp. MPI-SDFR-AT-0126]|nr:carbohydrate esterase family 3 protein [Leotiomycetes sp. MPI-SDFR-AT-0126]
MRLFTRGILFKFYIGSLLVPSLVAFNHSDGVSPYGDGYAPDVVAVEFAWNSTSQDLDSYPTPDLTEVANATNASELLDLGRRAARDFYLRVMPLGASITQGQGSSDGNGYRRWLRSQLRWKGWLVNMVGSKTDGTMADQDNEGHPGWVIDQVHDAWRTSKWMMPNLVLINAGTNDCVGGRDTGNAGTRLKSLVDDIFRDVPGVSIALSTLARSRDYDSCSSDVSQQIRNLVQSYSGSRIALADINNAMSRNDIGSDGTHPTDNGYKLFAGVWWNAISQLENGIQPPATVSNINDAAIGSSRTCKKVAGNAGQPVQSQLGSGHDDGNYVHSSTSRGILKTATIDKGGDPKSVTDEYPWHIFFANVVVGDPNADRKAALDDWIRIWHNDGVNAYYFRQNLGGGVFGDSVRFDVGLNCDLGPRYAFADFNNDGLADFFCIKADTSMTVSLNRGGNPPKFESIGQVVGAHDGFVAQDVRIADIDGDGRADFCLLQTDGTVLCSRNGGQGDSPQWQGFSTPNGVRGVVFNKNKASRSGIVFGELSDLNGDFRSDYMYIGDHGQVDTWINNRGWGGGIVPDWRSAGQTHPGQTDVGIQDRIKFGRIYGSNRLDYIYLKESDKQFDVVVWENMGSGGTKRKADGNFYCDMRGSGSDDYVWIYFDGRIDEINTNFHNPPQWGHNTELSISVPGPRVGIHLADWTGDGKCDILVQDKASGALRMYENRYDPANPNYLPFAAPIQVSGAGTCSEGWGVGIFDRGMRLADVDGDGRADILCLEKNGRVTGALNLDGHGTLQNVGQIKFSEGWDRANMRFADVEGSGRADLIHLDKYTGAATVFKNNGRSAAGSVSSFSWTNRGVLYNPIDRGETMHFTNQGGLGRADLLHVLPLTNRAWTYFNRCGGSGGDDGPLCEYLFVRAAEGPTVLVGHATMLTMLQADPGLPGVSDSNPGNPPSETGSGAVYIGPEVWSSGNPTVQCMP